MTHIEHMKAAGVATPCTAHHVNYDGGCLNCGWQPEDARAEARAEHTPGPWMDGGEYVRTVDVLRVIAQTYTGCDVDRVTARANSRLISAAPELLAALKAALLELETVNETVAGGKYAMLRGCCREAANQARAAIAKAEGR